MDYRQYIQRAIDYMEENLASDLDVAACAKEAGYSVYHFLRIFKEVTKLTPGDYIRKRRLSEIARKMIAEDTVLSTVAFEYGFNSKENFCRAFKAEHQVLPSEFQKAKNSLNLYDRLTFHEEPFAVYPQIVHLGAFSLTVFHSDGLSPPSFWNKYNCKKLSKRLSGGAKCEDYGVSVFTGQLDYYIGIDSTKVKGDSTGTSQLHWTAGLYAVFSTPPTTPFHFVNVIHKTWKYIQTVWLPASDYERCGKPDFEVYLEESRSFSEKIYIPVREKERLR